MGDPLMLKTAKQYLMTVMLVLFAVSFGNRISFAAPESTSAVSDGAAIENSVLERFRTYNGQRNLDELVKLFTPSATAIVRQQPLVAISDGRATIVIAAKISTSEDRAINFSLEKATLVSVRKLKTDEWEIKAIPEKNVFDMALLVKTDSGVVRYPLTVSPPLPVEIVPSEQFFINWLNLKDSEPGATSLDLNQDGRHDYIDDYIYTANYMSKLITSGDSREARRQRALQRTLSAPNSIPLQPVAKPGYDGILVGDP